MFSFRLKGKPAPTTQPIPIGGQVLIAGVSTKDEIDQVLQQHEMYGLISVDEVERSKTEFHGLCYSLDKPVNVSKMEAAMRRNVAALQQRGEIMRQQAAISVNNSIEHNLENSDTGANLRNFELSVVEEAPRGGKPEKLMAEGVRVNRDAGPRGSVPPAGRKGKRAA